MLRTPMIEILVLLAGLALLAGGARAQEAAGDPLAKVAKYEFGQSRVPLVRIEEMSRQADQKAKVEAAMIAVIQNDRATYAGKQFACRMLRLVGTEKAVPALAALLPGDAKLSHMARVALQAMPYPAVDEAFAKALETAKGDVRIGVIGSMGARKDGRAIPALAKLAAGEDQATADAAITTLGRIGGAEADRVLAALKPAGGKLAIAVADARVQVADQMLAAGQKDAAAAIYKSLYDESNPGVTRQMALRGIMRSGGAASLPTTLEALKGKEPRLAAVACKSYNEIPGAEATRALAEALPALPAATQVMALATLRARGDKSEADAAAKLLASGEENVKIAAAQALEVLGGGAQVKPLAELAAAEGATGEAAVNALALVNGEGAGPALLENAASGDPKVRVKAIEAIGTRRDSGAIAVLLKGAQDADGQVKAASAKALGQVGGEKDVPALAEMLVRSKSEDERSTLEKALVSIALRATDKDAAAGVLVDKLAAADSDAKANLMVVLAAVDSPKSYAALAEQLKSPDAALKKAAIRALATWPDEKPAPLLLEVARGDADPVCKVLALRGYVSVVGQAANLAPERKVAMLKDAWALASQAEDKNTIIKGVGNVPDRSALAMLEPLMTQPEVAMPAQYATLNVAKTIENKAIAAEALRKLIAVTQSEAVKSQAQQALSKLDSGAAKTSVKPAAKTARRQGVSRANAQRRARRQARGQRAVQ